MITAGIEIMKLLNSPWPRLLADSICEELSRVSLNGGARAVHQPVFAMSDGDRSDVISRPIVGTVHARVRLMTTMCRTTVPSLSVIQRGDQLTATELVGAAVATLIS